jgi:hypothetical protein
MTDFAPGFVGAARILAIIKQLTMGVWIWAIVFASALILMLRDYIRIYVHEPDFAATFLPTLIGSFLAMIVPLIWSLLAIRGLTNRSRRALLFLRILLWAIIPWQTLNIAIAAVFILIKKESPELSESLTSLAALILAGVAVYGLIKLRGPEINAFCDFSSRPN